MSELEKVAYSHMASGMTPEGTPWRNQDGVLWYPGIADNEETISVELYHVRAADTLIVGYDFDRDGYTIARAEHPDVEVAFIRSWADFEVAEIQAKS